MGKNFFNRGEFVILADKIIRLRKKNGWSQEELADKMNVSRQAVSKWEGAQSIPDLEKILQLGELFGVTTDYLLKDDIEDEALTKDVICMRIKHVSIEEANDYIKHRNRASLIIAIATLLCILSPIALFLLGAASDLSLLDMSEGSACGIGLAVLFLMVTVAVAMFVYCGFKHAPYEYLEKAESFELEHGVSGMVRERKKAFDTKYMLCNVGATCICVLSPVPLILGAFAEQEFLAVILLCVTMMTAGIGVFLFICCGVRMSCLQRLLHEGEYAEKEKKKSSLRETVGSVYWGVLTVIYLLWSFLTNHWHITWLVFAVGGALFSSVMTICDHIADQDKK